MSANATIAQAEDLDGTLLSLPGRYPSVSAAIYLCVAFGPLGLLYVRAPIAIVALGSAVAITGFWTGGFGAFVAWGLAIVAGAIWAVRARNDPRFEPIAVSSALRSEPIGGSSHLKRPRLHLRANLPALDRALAETTAALQPLSAVRAAPATAREMPKASKQVRKPSETTKGPRLPGWYFDPDDERQLRWWDGDRWTDTIMGK